MLNLPKSTEFNKRIPKQTFYENMDVSADVKKLFSEQIKTIYWMNKLAPGTINLAEGMNVKELQVFKIKLNQDSINENVLKQIDKAIPYHILFVLDYGDLLKLYIGYKEIKGKDYAVVKYYSTDWISVDNVNLTLVGTNLDNVYENFIKQIAGTEISSGDNDETIKDSIERSEKIKKIKKEIDVLTKKMWAEKQAKRKFELKKKIDSLSKELEEL